MKIRDIAIVLGIIALDLFTKSMVAMNLDVYESIKVIDEFFYITFAKNTGAAWSLFSNGTSLLTIISAIGITAFCWMYRAADSKDHIGKIAISMMIAGAFGNFYDRLVFGYVRDFLDFVIFGYDFPIFNIADMALCLGVGVLILQTLLKKEDEDGKEKLDC